MFLEKIEREVELHHSGWSGSRRWRALRYSSGLVALLTLLVGPAAWAQKGGSIAGRVGPRHDHGFVLATARITDLALKVEVGADGSFRFDEVRPGSYLVEVRVPSLGVAVESVVVRAGEESAVELVITPGSHSDEIVVTASAVARSPLDLAAATTSLSGEELALRLESSLGETLAQEAGVSSTFFGPGASRPIIRGLSGDRVRMLEGGLGTGDASGVSADHAVTVDPAQAERIEVIRGPATLLYGSSAVGGVVNVIDDRIPSSRSTGGLHGSVNLRSGSVNNERMGSLKLGGGRGDWAWHLGGIVREADDYEVPGFAQLEEGDHADEEGSFGFVANSDLESQGGRAGVSYFFDNKGFLGISVSGFKTEYGLPGGAEHGDEEEAEEGGEEIVRIDMKQQRFDLHGEVVENFGPFRGLKVRLGATDYEHVELEGGEDGTFFFNDSFEGRIEFVQKQMGRYSGSMGVQYFDRDLEAVGEEAFLPPTSTNRWAAFTLQEVETGSLRWQLGARFEAQDTDPVSEVLSSRSHEGLSASLGLVWRATEHFSLAASGARSVKLPAAEELFSNGLHIATQAFEVGDSALDEETGLGLDLSFRLETAKLSGELTFFRQGFDDFIFQAFTGEEEEGFPVVLYSQEDAEFSGAEVKARLELFERENHHLHLRLVGDVVKAELDSGGDLPRIPPLRLGAGLHYHSERWNASGEVRWVDRQSDVATNETPTDGYTFVNASLGYRFIFRQQIIDLLLRGRNLTDQEARSHTSFLKNIAPLPGRDIGLSVKFLF